MLQSAVGTSAPISAGAIGRRAPELDAPDSLSVCHPSLQWLQHIGGDDTDPGVQATLLDGHQTYAAKLSQT